MRKIFKNLLAIFALTAVSLAMAVTVNAATQSNTAADTANPYWGPEDVAQNIEDTIQLGKKDPREIAASVINIILGFLGIIAVILILAGGFKWMIAAGNQDKVDEAKKLMAAGVIGLIIILASFGIARFVINALVTATS